MLIAGFHVVIVVSLDEVVFALRKSEVGHGVEHEDMHPDLGVKELVVERTQASSILMDV